MDTRRLRIILELITGKFSGGVQSAVGIFRGFISGIGTGVKTAIGSLKSLAEGFFFVTSAVEKLIGIARGLWDMLIGGAQSVAQLEARFIALTGSQQAAAEVMDFARERALELGKPISDVANGLFLMASNAKDASGAFDMGRLKELNGTLEGLAALRPDLPVERLARGLNSFLTSGDISSLEMILDLPLRSTQSLRDITADLNQQTKSITHGVATIEFGAAATAENAYDRLKAIQDAIGELAPGLSESLEIMGQTRGMERLARIGEDLAQSFGGPLFRALNETANQLSDLYERDPEKFRQIAETLGEAVAGLVEALAELATSDFDADKLAERLGALADAIAEADLVGTLADIAQAMQDAAQAAQAVLQTIEDIQRLREQVAGQTVMGGALEGANGGQRPISTLAGAGTVMGGGLEQRVKLEVHVISDDKMFKTRVKRIAGDVVTEGFNALDEELENAQ